MIFISAGHNSKSKTIKPDSGAVANGYQEGDLTIDFRDRVCRCLTEMKVPFITDYEEESLSMYLNRIKTGSGSVVIEYHFDSADSSTASGTTSIVEEEADRLDKSFATEIANANSSILGLRNRGVISEAESHRGRLGLMREEGIICLSELCFISSIDDLKKYFAYRDVLARRHAEIIVKYENML